VRTPDVGLAHEHLWRTIGRIGIALIVVLSLAPLPPSPVEIAQGDKLGHFLVYLALTTWYAQLAPTRSTLAWRVLAFAVMGVALEVLQTQTGWRQGNDPWDAIANVAGAAGGFALGLTPARRLLVAFEQRVLGRRREPR